MNRALALLTALLVLAVAVEADAAPHSQRVTHAYPGQRLAPDLQADVKAALRTWAERGVTGCPIGVTAYWADDLAGADGRGWPCELWLLASAYEARAGSARQPWLCAVIEHEVGHALGLEHSDAATWPVMHENSPTPARCMGQPRNRRARSNRKYRAHIATQLGSIALK